MNRHGLPSGLIAFCVATAVAGTACAGESAHTADQTGQVTVIPGNSAADRPGIDFKNAIPLPLPSADPPERDPRVPVEPHATGPEGSSSPGRHGSGETHRQLLPDK